MIAPSSTLADLNVPTEPVRSRPGTSFSFAQPDPVFTASRSFLEGGVEVRL